MKRGKEPPNAVSALRRWRERQRHDRAAEAERRAVAAREAEAARRSGLRRAQAAERQAEQKAEAISNAASELTRQESYFIGRKDEAEARRILGMVPCSLAAFAAISFIGPPLTIYHLSHHPIPRDENALLIGLSLLAVFLFAFGASYGWFAFWFQPWRERKRDAADASQQLDQIAKKRQALEDGAFTVIKSRRPFGGPFEVRFNDHKA